MSLAKGSFKASSDTTNSLRSLQETGKSPSSDPNHYNIQPASKAVTIDLHKVLKEPLFTVEASKAYGFDSIEDCEPFSFELEFLDFPIMLL